MKTGGEPAVGDNSIVLTVDARHRPVEFFHLHADIADYFHHGGQQFENFGLQPTE